MDWSVERLIDEVDLLASRGLPRTEFFAELAPRLRRVIGNDATCWHTLDPQTGLMTSDTPDELIDRGVFTPEEAPAAGELVVRSEYIVEDVNTFAHLARRRVPVGILDHVTRGAPERSARGTAISSSRPTSPTSCGQHSLSAGGCGARCTSPVARPAARSSNGTPMHSPA